MRSLAGKLRSITFLAVNDEVSFLVACCYGVDYTIAVRIFGQNCGDEGVGARVLGNERSISAKRNSSLTSARERERTHGSHKSMIETHTDRRYKSFTQSKASAG